MMALTDLQRIHKVWHVKSLEAIEVELLKLLEASKEKLLNEKFPKKIKESPKTIHFIDSLRIITSPQI